MSMRKGAGSKFAQSPEHDCVRLLKVGNFGHVRVRQSSEGSLRAQVSNERLIRDFGTLQLISNDWNFSNNVMRFQLVLGVCVLTDGRDHNCVSDNDAADLWHPTVLAKSSS